MNRAAWIVLGLTFLLVSSTMALATEPTAADPGMFWIPKNVEPSKAECERCLAKHRAMRIAGAVLLSFGLAGAVVTTTFTGLAIATPSDPNPDAKISNTATAIGVGIASIPFLVSGILLLTLGNASECNAMTLHATIAPSWDGHAPSGIAASLALDF